MLKAILITKFHGNALHFTLLADFRQVSVVPFALAVVDKLSNETVPRIDIDIPFDNCYPLFVVIVAIPFHNTLINEVGQEKIMDILPGIGTPLKNVTVHGISSVYS